VSGSAVTIGFNTRGRLRPSTSAFPYSIANRQASSASLKWPNTPDAQRAPFGFVTMTIDAKLPRSPAAKGHQDMIVIVEWNGVHSGSPLNEIFDL